MKHPHKLDAPCGNGTCRHPYGVHYTTNDGDAHGCAAGRGADGACRCSVFIPDLRAWWDRKDPAA
jgi:hypothetical protein